MVAGPTAPARRIMLASGNGLGVGSYADVIGNPHVGKPYVAPGGNNVGPLLLNPGAFAAPRGLSFGNSGRNYLRNPSRVNFNMSLFKHFKPFQEKLDIEFRAEAYNVFNHTQFRITDPANPGNTGNNVINCYGSQSELYSAGASGCLAGNSFLHPVDAHDPAHSAIRSQGKLLVENLMSRHEPFRKSWSLITVMGGILPLFLFAGCGGGSTKSTSPSNTQKQPQTYLAPYVAGTTNGSGTQLLPLTGTETYAIDDTANAFSQSIFGLGSNAQGPQAINVGVVTKGQRGLLDLGITANYAPSGGTYVATPYSPAMTGSFAVELAGQAGGLAQIVGQPAVPLVAASQCPSLPKPQTWQFITIPGGLIQSSSSGNPDRGTQRQIPHTEAWKSPPTAARSPSITSASTRCPRLGALERQRSQQLLLQPESAVRQR